MVIEKRWAREGRGEVGFVAIKKTSKLFCIPRTKCKSFTHRLQKHEVKSTVHAAFEGQLGVGWVHGFAKGPGIRFGRPCDATEIRVKIGSGPNAVVHAIAIHAKIQPV